MDKTEVEGRGLFRLTKCLLDWLDVHLLFPCRHKCTFCLVGRRCHWTAFPENLDARSPFVVGSVLPDWDAEW